MPKDDIKPPAGGASRDPVGDGAKPSGESGKAPASRGQGSGGAGGNPAKSKQPPTPDKSTPTDDDADDGTALLKALSGGTMDDLEEDGTAAEPKDDADDAADDDDTEPGDDDADAEGDEPVADDDAEPKAEEEDPEKEPEAEPKADGDDLTTDEKAEVEAAPKGQRKGMAKLFKERKELRTQLDDAKGEAEAAGGAKRFADAFIADATDAGLVSEVTGEDGAKRRNFSALRDLLAQEKALAQMTPDKRADYYRRLADEVHPEGRPITLPEDLADKVASEIMTKDEAELIARHRDNQRRGPIEAERRQREEQTRNRDVAERAKVQEAHTAARTKAEGEIADIMAPYVKKYGPQWKAIAEQVVQEMQEHLPDVAPTGWPKLAKRVLTEVLSKRTKPLKTPISTPSPSGGSRSSGADDDVMSEEDERSALGAGRL